MAREWYVSTAGRIDGPVTSRELAERAAAGKLAPTDQVSLDRQKWVPAGKVKGLKFPPQALRGTVVVPEPTATTPSSSGGPAAPLGDVPGYAILGPLGEGGMGVVYRARQLKLDRTVALKTVGVAAGTAPAILARFEKEAVALAKLQHPNIVAVYDCGRAGDRLFYAMELLAGEDFDQRIERAGRLDEQTAWLIARQAAAGLAHAAGHGIIHRDVKPANLFLVPAPVGSGLPAGVPMVKVTDFGLALTRGGPADQRLTTTGTMVGTPIYMAPEQFQTSDLDHRADIYALGASVFHALSGELPFNLPTIWELMLAKQEAPPRLGPPASVESVALVADMMAKLPHRIATYEEVIARIDALACVRGAAPAAYRRPRRVRRWVAVGVGAAVLAAAGVGAALAFREPPHSPTPPPESARFVVGGFSDEFDTGTLLGWLPSGWRTAPAEDKGVKLLTGRGTLVRRFAPLANYRVTVGFDLHEATALEVVVASPGDAGRRVVVRVTKSGAVLGTRDGDRGAFVPVAPEVPFPTPEELSTRGPYRAIEYERAGPVWRAMFEGKVVGTVPDDGTPKAAELRVIAEGGEAFVESARVEELRESR